MSRKSLLRGCFRVGALLVCYSSLTPATYAKEPKVTVTPYASIEAIRPGQPFEVAFQFEIQKAWHIYWKNSGDAGLPPVVDWDLPEGFKTSALSHPAPKRHLDRGGIVTFIHEDRPILTATVTPPSNLKPASHVELKGEMTLLVCKVQCIRMSKPFKLRLPVASPGSQVSLANEKLFAEARSRFPEPIGEAKYLKIKPVVNVDKIRPQDEFKLAVVVDIGQGYHIQSHKPLTASFIATDVFLEPTEDITFSAGKYPAHKIRTLPGNMKVAEYAGRVVVQFQGKADNTLADDTLRFAGVLRYQACNEKGQCFRPQNIQWEVNVPVGKEGESVREIESTYFSAALPVGGGQDTPKDAKKKAIADAAPSNTDQSSAALADGESVEGETQTDEPTQAGQAQAREAQTGQEQGLLERFGLAGLLLGCFVYGLFLNATPCVLPLLSIKVLGFVQQAHESRRRTLALGLSFGIGVVLFFIALGFLAAAGKNLLQYPAVVIGLGAVVMALALSMLGVYTLKAPDAAAKLDARIQQEGLLASFGKGTLAPLLGFACVGPMLAGAFTWATQQPPHIAVFAFLFAGLGMAFPYMLLGANPNWLSFLPKPGNWMITFERIMGFLLLGMVVWLIHPLVAQIGAEGLEWTLAFFVAIAFACWIVGKIDMIMPAVQRWRYRGAAVTVVAVAAVVIYGRFYPVGPAMALQDELRRGTLVHGGGWERDVPWKPWSPQAVEEAVQSGKTVFVDFTASYCAKCNLNKKFAINTAEVRAKMKECGVVPLQGDFTTGDEAIFAELQKHGRTGLPVNLIYKPRQLDHPILLDIDLSKQYLLEKLDQACTSSGNLALNP